MIATNTYDHYASNPIFKVEPVLQKKRKQQKKQLTPIEHNLNPTFSDHVEQAYEKSQIKALVEGLLNGNEKSSTISKISESLLQTIITENQKIISETMSLPPKRSPKSILSMTPAAIDLTCDKCGKTYSRRDNLVAHQRVHTDERPYKCQICPKSFRWMSALRHHEKMHQRKNECVQILNPVNIQTAVPVANNSNGLDSNPDVYDLPVLEEFSDYPMIKIQDSPNASHNDIIPPMWDSEINFGISMDDDVFFKDGFSIPAA